MTDHRSAENVVPLHVWHDEADRFLTWGTLDPPDACMCRDCVLNPAGKPSSDQGGDPS